MKYQVQISYTNPSHEHVALRRRVDSVTRIVEANSETEALNRAANQQRALGFMIKEAKVLDEAAKDWKKAFQKVASKNLNKDIASLRTNVHRLEKATGTDKQSREIAAHDAESDDDVEAVKNKVKKGMKEEVENLSEGIAADMLASKREKKQKAVRDKILDQELQSRKVARGKARQAGTMGHPAKANRFEKLKNEDKANVAAPKKVSKINIALNKMKKKAVNMMPTLDAEKK